jgi:hypothetical protein
VTHTIEDFVERLSRDLDGWERVTIFEEAAFRHGRTGWAVQKTRWHPYHDLSMRIVLWLPSEGKHEVCHLIHGRQGRRVYDQIRIAVESRKWLEELKND